MTQSLEDKYPGAEQGHPLCSQLKKQHSPPSSEEAVGNSKSSSSNNNRNDAVFQANVPPPSHQPHLPSAVPSVVAYPVSVPHWAHNAPPPPPPGTSHFPISMQGGYVFPNQPPPPLVTNGDAATIAFVAAMSTVQPLYAIPGVPLQSIHTHYPGTAGFQVEPMDLSVPVVAQQPVTVHHFVQPDGIVFTASHPLHAPVTLDQSQAIPVTNAVHNTPTHIQNNFTNVQVAPPYDPHQGIVNATPGFHSDSHIVHIPPDVDPPSVSSQETNIKTVQQSETNKPLTNKNNESPKSQSNNNVTSSKPIPVSSSSSKFEFVGPMVFGPDNISSSKKPFTIGKVTAQSEVSLTVSNGVAKLNISDNAEASSSNVTGSPVSLKSTQEVSTPEIAKTVQVPLSEPSVPSVSSQPPIDKLSPTTETKFTEANQPSVTTSPTQAAPQPQTPRMWSSLFGKSKVNNSISSTSPTPVALSPPPVLSAPADEVKSVRYWQEKEKAEAKRNPVPPQKVVPVGVQSDPIAPKILDVLSSLPVVHTPLVIQPRGLVNGSNVCFMNATLQVLMGCPPFIHLFRAFKNLPPRQNSGSCTPIFDSLIEFVNSFHNGQRVKSQGSKNKKGAHMDINVGQPFSPASLLSVAQDILGLRIGIQHDAEEFLSKILMICHEELENVLKLNHSYALNNNNQEIATNNGHVDGSEVDDDVDGDDESWQKVGPKNHHVETNVGENVHSVADALQRLNLSETLHDIDGLKIQGQRRMFFDVLPPVLIMHLKLFQYSDGNGKKIQKKIDFDVDLTIPKETLSRVGKNKYMSPKSRSYKLFGVVNHHGLKMTDGHYTSDVFLPIASGWLRFDDSEVYAIHEKQVLQHSDRHMPYLLFYRRMDVS
ncbi:ubiquitin carboxyl-terminal hydrolase 10 [Elysia marginata]|uniref:ubiquitinyl hydrolase 1 n=1 Tax=Elysia marginata TaxID=1093978 RepID=A0AAV4ETR3_9GAST|nr:ubiquitin carboxyl-terminal hydrolase 10 [Elysia marginata]